MDQQRRCSPGRVDIQEVNVKTTLVLLLSLFSLTTSAKKTQQSFADFGVTGDGAFTCPFVADLNKNNYTFAKPGELKSIAEAVVIFAIDDMVSDECGLLKTMWEDKENDPHGRQILVEYWRVRLGALRDGTRKGVLSDTMALMHHFSVVFSHKE